VVDADDIVMPRAFSQSMSKLNNTHELVYTYRDLIDSAGNQLSIHNKNKIRYTPDQLLVDNMIFHLRTFSTSLFRRAGGVGKFERCEDWDENLRMTELTTVRCIPQVLYRYRIHKDQISRTPQQNVESQIAVRQAISRRGVPYELQVNDRGFQLKHRRRPPLTLP